MKKLITILVIFLLLSCGKKESTYTVETIDGVNFVNNLAPKWGGESKIELEFVRKIGTLDGDDENFLFYFPRDIARDSKGNYYILDGGNYRIQVFDANLNFIRSIGRQGQGPGEFEYPNRLFINDNDVLQISDGRNLRVEYFDSDGNLIKSVPVSNLSTSSHFSFDGDIVIRGLKQKKEYANPMEMAQDIRKGQPLATILSSSGDILFDFGIERAYDDMGMKIFGNRFNYTYDDSGNHYITFYFQNRIDKFSPAGKHILSVKRQLNYEETQSLERVIDIKNDISSSIQVDSHGSMWVQTYERQLTPEERINRELIHDAYRLEIYDKEGVMLGIIPMPLSSNIFMTRIIDDRIYFVDSTLEMCIYEYKIVEK